MKNKIIDLTFNIIIICIIIMPVALFVYYYWFYTTPPSPIFVYNVNISTTSDGWIVKLCAWVRVYTDEQHYYDKYNIKLSKIIYIIVNYSDHYGSIYEDGYLISIKNKPSPLGIIFYDVDNDNLLSDEDYMFIPKHENNSTLKYPHSGDYIFFRHSEYGVMPLEEDTKLP